MVESESDFIQKCFVQPFHWSLINIDVKTITQRDIFEFICPNPKVSVNKSDATIYMTFFSKVNFRTIADDNQMVQHLETDLQQSL